LAQAELIRTDNIASADLPDLRKLDIQPRAVGEIVPIYSGCGTRLHILTTYVVSVFRPVLSW